jgi:hypothetical protein
MRKLARVHSEARPERNAPSRHRPTDHRAGGIIPRAERACSHRRQGSSPEPINRIPDGGQRGARIELADARKVLDVIDHFVERVGFWHVRGVTPAATRAAATKGAADVPARSPFMPRPRCRTVKALSCSDPVLFSIGAQLRVQGSRVLYFAGSKTIADATYRYRVVDIERAADQVVWCCDEPPGWAPGRPQDRAFVGNVVQAIEAYGSGRLDPAAIPLEAVDRIIAIGSDGMMNAVAEARRCSA